MNNFSFIRGKKNKKWALMGSELLLFGYTFGFVIVPNVSESLVASCQIVGGGILAVILVAKRTTLTKFLLKLPIWCHFGLLALLSAFSIFGVKLLSILPTSLYGKQQQN